uniref:Uncharacterized protein n=1 Tax=viral metagenome TaxID=1070528 RepID=A0A6H1ZAN1_9ZZZZ
MADIGGLSNLFQNKLFLQYLSGAGGAISAGQPAGPVLDKITQQNIASQNFMKMLQQMMGDAASSKTSSKATLDGTKLKYETDMSELGKELFPGAAGMAGAGGSAGLGKMEMNPLNPFASPAMSGADLAGLTPENISQALQFKFMGQEMENKKMSDLVDMIYKRALTEQAMTATTAAKPIFTVPGTDIRLNSKEYLNWYKEANKDERTAAIKNFEYAQERGYRGDFEQFQDVSKTAHQKDFAAARKDGYTGSFNEWMLEMAKAGAINLSEIVERKAATEDVSAKKYFTDPKGLVRDVDKHINSEEVQNQLMKYIKDPRQREIETIRAKEKFIVSKINASGGKIVDQKLDGRTFVFTVKWPDGTTSEVRHAN